MTNKTTIKEHPILFSTPMIRALLSGHKTQTRRVMNPQPGHYNGMWMWKDFRWGAVDNPTYPLEASPYGKIGEHLWVREKAYIAPKNWTTPDETCLRDKDGDLRYLSYCADLPNERSESAEDYGLKPRVAFLMPRWASRITLEVTNVRVEQLNDISEEDAKAEGVELVRFPIQSGNPISGQWYWKGYEPNGIYYRDSAKESFRTLWNFINGKGAWKENSFVWVVEFRVLDAR